MTDPPLGAWMADCVQPETLLAFLLGKLPEADLEGVAVHLAGCPACQEATERLEPFTAGDRFQQYVRHWLLLPLPADRVWAAIVQTVPLVSRPVVRRADRLLPCRPVGPSPTQPPHADGEGAPRVGGRRTGRRWTTP
ncbi:MAG: zf-HC2 domain-containing protein [Gemmataceae bacterium]